MSAQDICILAAFLAAGFVHGVAGFGAGIVAMSIIPAAFTMLDAVPIVAVLWLLVTAALLAGGLRKHLGTPELRATIPPLIGGAYAGVPLGLRLLTSVDQRVLRLALGVCMLVFVVERTLHDLGWLGRPAEPPPGDRGESGSDSERSEQLLTPLTPESGEAVPGSALLPAPRTEQPLATTLSRAFWAVLVGLGSGMLSGALNEGGPPVVIFLALQGWSKDSVKAGLQAIAYFLLMTSLQVALLWHRGLLAPRHLYYDMVGLPALAVGLGLGVRVYGRIDQRSFGRVLIAAMLCGGIAYILDSVRKLVSSA